MAILKLNKATDKANSEQQHLQFVYFHKGVAWASDGHICVKAPIEEVFGGDIEGFPETFAVYTEDFKDLVKGDCVPSEDGKGIEVHGKNSRKYVKMWFPTEKESPRKIKYFRDVVTIPDYSTRFPDSNDEMYANPNVSGIIGLNAKLLATIQMVFDSVAVKLSVASVSKAILVRPINSEDVSVQAIIMPFRVD